MGVQGLTTFIDENSQLLTDTHLHDTKVVIDGNNLYFFLYRLYGVREKYGGDYDIYYDSCRSYFKTLQSVGIEPYVLFDGCYEADDRKLQTILRRANDKITTSNVMSKGGNGNLLPLMANTIFRQTLDDLNIWHYTCEGEADGEVAALANKLECPVMSNDSDFYIYDLKNGFILFDYLNLQVMSDQDENGKDYKYLHAQVYYVDNMLKMYPRLTREAIPLFATLMGNDFVERRHFDAFYKTANVNQPQGKRQGSNRRHYKMAQMLDWMNKYKGDIRLRVIECLPQETKEKVKQLIDFSIRNYTQLVSTISESRLSMSSTESSGSTWRSYHGNQFPEWFISAARSGKIFTHYLNALVLKRVFLPCQIEISKLPSTMDCGKSLRQIICSVLFTLDTENVDELFIAEYVREDLKLVNRKLPLLDTTPNGVSIPKLRDLPEMNMQEKEIFFYQCLEVDPMIIAETPNHLKHFVALMIFFMHKVTPKVSRSFVHSLILCFVKLSVVDQNPGYGQLKDFNLPDLHRAKERLKRFVSPVQHNHANRFKGQVVHSLCQFQACWWYVLQLGELLSLPHNLPSLAKAINGTLIYHLCSVLSTKSDPLLYIKEQLGHKSSVMDYFDLIANNIIQDTSSVSAEEKTAKKTKKSRKKPKRKVEQSQEKREDSDTDESPTLKANCDLSNRFSRLLAAN